MQTTPTYSLESGLWEELGLSTPILEIFSEQEIRRHIRVACAVYENLDQTYDKRVRESIYYQQLVHGNVSDLVWFLRSFQNKGACWYAHETRMRVGEVFLTPEMCIQKHGYSGCGHPELNWLLLAEVLTNILVDHAHPIRKNIVDISPSVYYSLTLGDTWASLFYQKTSEPTGGYKVIPISTDIRQLQNGFWETAQIRLMEMADLLEQAYK